MPDTALRQAYLAYLKVLRRYHRYTVEGLETLLEPGGKIVVGYHGRGFPMDLALLCLEIHERHGYLPHAIVHSGLHRIPGVRTCFEAAGTLPGDSPRIAAALARGEHVFIAPGGTQEACRRHDVQYKVDWRGRTGYLKMARRYGVPLVPVASSGVDGRFIGLNDGHAWGKRLHMPLKIPAWIAVGLGGFFPVAPPLPVAIHTVVGDPIAVTTLDGPHGIEPQHRAMTERVQSLLDLALARAAHDRR